MQYFLHWDQHQWTKNKTLSISPSLLGRLRDHPQDSVTGTNIYSIHLPLWHRNNLSCRRHSTEVLLNTLDELATVVHRDILTHRDQEALFFYPHLFRTLSLPSTGAQLTIWS